MERKFKHKLYRWKGTDGPIKSFWLCSSWSFTCKTCYVWWRWKSSLLYTFFPPKLKQCVRINHINSGFLNVISGVPYRSIVGPALFNSFFNEILYVIETINANNFADDNTLTTFANNIQNLIYLLSLKALWQLNC